MSREILIQVKKNERQVAIMQDGRVDDFFIEVDRYQSLLGNIYKGKIESIMPSINAAFVNIGQGKNGFLYLTDAANPLLEEDIPETKNFLSKIFSKKEANNSQEDKKIEKKNDYNFKVGQEILVQVVKDPFGDKGARLTTHLSLPGRFVVYMPCDNHNGISKKIEDPEERKRLKEVIQCFNFAKTGGIIVRTACLGQGKREIVRDSKFLYNIWLKINKKTEKETAPCLIYEEGELTWKIVRDYLTDKVDRLTIDNHDEYLRIRKFVQTLIGKQMVNKIQFYKEKANVSLFESQNAKKDLKSIYDTHVYCKSGAYVVIEPTEALTVIDVNSGKFKVKASPGDAAFMVNMEVVPEIARQLRLRDLGGIIVIDFIDMVKEDHKRKVVDLLKKELSKDHAKTEVMKISQLGLLQMTRARTGKNIESISFGKCPYCSGRGSIKIV